MSMTSTPPSFADSLMKRAGELTAQHLREGAKSSPPPVIAAQSPLHELLIDEVTASLPPPVAERMRASTSVAQAHDWIAAAAMYRWIMADKVLAQRFLADLRDRPSQAGLSLARTVALTLEPPPPDPAAVLLDRWGLVLQFLAVLVVLVVRGLLFAFLLPPATGAWWMDPESLLSAIAVPAPSWLADPPVRLATALGLACSSGWLFLECAFVPRLLERCRRFPLCRLPPRVCSNWRLDSFLVFWVLQAVLLQVGHLVRTIQLAVRAGSLFAEAPAEVIALWSCAVLAAVTIVAVVCRVTWRGIR